MEKIKSLLLPLALIFSAIAVFEFGARYGATNMQAYAIAGELQFPLNIYAQNEADMDNRSKEYFEHCPFYLLFSMSTCSKTRNDLYSYLS